MNFYDSCLNIYFSFYCACSPRDKALNKDNRKGNKTVPGWDQMADPGKSDRAPRSFGAPRSVVGSLGSPALDPTGE